ncbi:MAG: methyltransferase domain-containing protein [Patescibacteria group bacterium]
MDYNDTYLKSKNAWGGEPNKLLQMIIDDIPAGSNVLDLGSAQGRDSLYLASFGHNIVAVEKSEAGYSQLVDAINENKITNIVSINKDVSEFDIEKNKYFLINLQNVLQFLSKEDSRALLRKAKDSLPINGLIAVSAFTTEDPSFENSDPKIKSYFENNELLELFSDFQIIYYFEKKILDKGHASMPEPHYHGMVKIIAKKL